MCSFALFVKLYPFLHVLFFIDRKDFFFGAIMLFQPQKLMETLWELIEADVYKNQNILFNNTKGTS